ncbi:MAG TPA: hypothetical protein VKY74_23270 [Chloroflexia bacterium]|nr:hypothetical protein [Chloroflexia bacterium]
MRIRTATLAFVALPVAILALTLRLLGPPASGPAAAAPAARPAPQITIPGSGSRTFPETGHTVQGIFLSYWTTHGGLAQQGYPISELLSEVSPLDGKTYIEQYFERAVFEYHPENQPPFDVLLSQLGTFRYRAQYGTPPAPPVTPTTGAGAVFEQQVVLSFVHIAPVHITVPAGRVRFLVTNTDTGFGQTQHNFTILTADGAVVGATPSFTPNEGQQVFEVDLPAGTYQTRCTVPGHAEHGMVGTLTATAP